MTVQKIKSGRIITQVADTYVGNYGQIFYEEAIGELRLSDGVTPGGIPIVSSGASNIITLDGGRPDSNYGGLEIIEGGGV